MAIKSKESKPSSTSSTQPQLDLNRIIDVSIDLLNKEGLQQLTMRKLADALEIRAASLYWHVKNKSELLQMIAEKICSEIQIPISSLNWEEQIMFTSNEYRSALLTVRDSAEILIATIPFTPKRLLIIDTMFKTFLDAGLPPEEVVMTSTTINNFVLSFVKDEMRIISTSKKSGKSVNEIVSSGGELLSNLPKDLYPTMVFLAGFISKIDSEREFHFGLELIIEGIKKKLSAQK